MAQPFSPSDIARFFGPSSATSHHFRPNIRSRALTTSNLSSGLGMSNSFLKTASAQRTPLDNSSLSLASVHDKWIEGLTQYTDFHLHAALSAFRRLLRELRSSTDEIPSPTTSVHSHTESTPYRILLPEEVALLYVNIALIHGYLGSYYLAAAAFEEALVIDETSGIAWFGLGIARFYLRELGASKRAFVKCQERFVVLDENGMKSQKDDVAYKIWPPQFPTRSKPSAADESISPVDDSNPWQEFKTVLGRAFPDGVWKLERTRVEWNWRIAVFERNYVRKGIERPGGGKWGLNGIPAGVIFGPTFVIGSDLAAIHGVVNEKTTAEAIGLAITASPDLSAGVKGRSGSLVKQKWSLLQQKLLRRKPNPSIPPLPIRRTKSTESLASPKYTNDEPMSFSNVDAPTEASPAGTAGTPSGILRKSMPSTLPLTPYQVLNSYHENSDAHITTSLLNLRKKLPHEALPSLFPPRRSSLTLALARSPSRPRRSSRGSLLVASTTSDEIEHVEEKPADGESMKQSTQQPTPFTDTTQETDGSLVEDQTSSSRSSDISPKSLAPKKWTDDIMLPNLILDLAPVPSPAPTILPRTASSSQYGFDSFMTDNISPLSSQTRSAMFPAFSDRQSPSSRRPSYATDVWNASSDPSEAEDSSNQDHRRPSAIITLTPATPEKISQYPPMTATILGPLVDSYYLAPSSSPSYPTDLEAYLNDEDMAVEPLSITKKERMSITGRTCLGEWEWEEEYQRWKQEESIDNDEDEDDTVGELLLPRRFEGYGAGV